jgi:uncharacterized protein YfaS (alpha-2-macroglobulin family)
MLRSSSLRLAVVAVGVQVLAACGTSQRASRPDIGPQDPRWRSYLSHHTGGVISRRDKIRIAFVNDVVAEDRVGQSAEGAVRVEPPIDGSITFAAAREILIVPDRDLPSEQWYRVAIEPGRLLGFPADLERYEFALLVMKQDFEVAVTGLMPSAENDSDMVLQGTLATADVDDADRIERMVGAKYLGRDLMVRWQHDSTGRRHEFAVSPIRRQAATQRLELAWDGAAIGVSSTGSRTVEVPALYVFAITRVAAVEDERQYILVQFSDSLDRGQNLSGLIRLSEPLFTMSVDANAVRLMPQRRLAGRATVTFEPGIRSARGRRLEARSEHVVTFASDKPRVRFAGTGTVLPDNPTLSIPFEAVNVHSVQVTAFRIFETRIGQFLQANKLDGAAELGRVGRYLWRRTISLPQPTINQWNRYSLDVTDLVRQHPAGMYRISLSINRGNSSYTCTEQEDSVPVPDETALRSLDDADPRMYSSWDWYEAYYDPYGGELQWSQRGDPCNDAYYRFGEEVRDARNFLVSNIGILVKRDQQNGVFVLTTDLKTAEPMTGVLVGFMNFQDQPIGNVTTGAGGTAQGTLDGVPFYAVAQRGADRGYLKMSPGLALSTSTFDVGGAAVTGGLKGLIYGERGVWRPGDDMHLTFVLEDQEDAIPDNHPVTMQLFSPAGQRIETETNATPTNGFYLFTMKTAPDAPTGNWTVAAELGGSRFSRTVKVEAVMPNRLKVELDFGGARILGGAAPVHGAVLGQWLTGAIAGNLRADVQVRYTPTTTRLGRFADFTFDDPARLLKAEPQTIFEGTLDAAGRAAFDTPLAPGGDAPGMLTATFTTRIFERSGAFSTNVRSETFSPFPRYVGIRLPRGDAMRGMLLTDTTHTVDIVTVTPEGQPTSVRGVQLTLYKVEWKWWWDKSGESLAQFATAEHRAVVARGEANTADGRGTWQFEIKYPAWGRYLLRACDPVGRHCAGKTVYIDWPGWAGRAQEDAGAGAAVLTFFSDKSDYTVGEVAHVELPEAAQGRALLTIENGTSILDQRWLELGGGRTRFDVPITGTMSPTAYVAVTVIQPHVGRSNDRPIRLYGIIPLVVADPATRLAPVIAAAEEWRPESTATIEVSEATGRAMTYTLAVVDEGLLGLTSFATPDLHAHFYQKEALGVTTWDIFDDVVGAYGGELERLLALGGSGEAEGPVVEEEESRFPPVVRFLGPFTLRPRARNTHHVELPKYIGAVRVMVVAGQDGAYGSASQSVFVREPLSLLATLPRVIGPDEELTVPVTVFAMDSSIRRVSVEVRADNNFTIVGPARTAVGFTGAGDQLTFLRLRASSRPGRGRIRIAASSERHRSDAEITLEIRSPSPMAVRRLRQEIAAGAGWRTDVVPFGLPGTNSATLEVTALPPLNLEDRLDFLVRYPHGCVEQVTSAVFPQLYLPSLVRLERGAREAIERNVRTGIDRLRGFQNPTGAFVYWPGGFAGGGPFGVEDSWITNYVGHFLLEAGKAGYHVPAEMLADWINFQKRAAQAWTKGGESEAMDQAYRVYTLALAGRAELGAMNRLREAGSLNTAARWQLAAAYRLAGLPDVAQEVVRDGQREVSDYVQPGPSLGSRLRDQAIVLASLVTLERRDEAQSLAEEISAELFSDHWYSTHSVAFALLAMSAYHGAGRPPEGFTFERRIGAAPPEAITAGAPLLTDSLTGIPEGGAAVEIRNTSGRPLYAAILLRGVPKPGEEAATAEGLALDVQYTTAAGVPLDVAEVAQGTDLIARLTVTNRTRMNLRNIALEHMVPAGWEIHNPRLATETEIGRDQAIDYQDIRDDRIYSYFGLDAGASKTVAVQLNASYLGKYYLPGVSVAAMYDAAKHARTAGGWTAVVRRNP